ncbi:MAG: HAMP domain-containing histidine kinase [Gemmatimonadota bacterium]|nr:HAMP domain-containing histidine kinase [Gemmatimonadota bacterium]
MEEPPPAEELLVCARRLFRAVSVIQQVTTSHYLRLADERVHHREEQLRSFNRAVSHEMKNRINTIRGATEMLREEWVADDAKQRERFTDIIARSTEGMQGVISSLIELSRLDSATTQPRNVLLSSAATEVARQLREFAAAREVQIRISDDLPEVEVPAAAVELCLSNYLSNAVKYRDPAKAERWVRVEGKLTSDSHGGHEVSQVVVQVRDNGLGVPAEARERLFERFFRAHEETVTGEEGTGLGLTIVRETIEAIGGRAWAEFGADSQTCFMLSLPLRAEDPAADSPNGVERGESVAPPG